MNSKYKPFLMIFLMTLVLRFGIYVFSLIYISSFDQFLQIWTKWDTYWYISIAKTWYVTAGKDALAIVFYPGYPIFLKLVNYLFNNFEISSLVVALSFSFIASYYLYKLVLIDFDKQTALRSVWFLNIFPTSYFLQAGYTESMFLALTLMSVYYFRKEKVIQSAALSLLAGLTRANGILLSALLFMEVKTKRQLLPTIFPIVGFIIYLLINWFTFKDPFYFTIPLASNWFKHFAFPWQGITTTTKMVAPFSDPSFYIYASELAALILIFLTSIYTFFRIRKSYAFYMFLNLLLITSTSFILGTPRYALTLFPIYIVLASFKNRFIFIFLSIISLALLIYFNNLFVKGMWAF